MLFKPCLSRCVRLLTGVLEIITVGHLARRDLLVNSDHKPKTSSPDLHRPAERHCPFTAIDIVECCIATALKLNGAGHFASRSTANSADTKETAPNAHVIGSYS